MSDEILREAERFFHERIPLTRTMGMRVVADSIHGFAVEAPVSLNSNHLQTAFGGSVNAVATLAGYGLLWMELRGESAHIVIASSSIRFLQPVRRVIRAVCHRPDDKKLRFFHALLREKGKARLSLRVEVTEEEKRAAKFEATFVAFQEMK